MKKYLLLLAVLALAVIFTAPADAQTAGKPDKNDLVIAKDGATEAVIVVAPDAGKWEQQAATDLQKYIEMMSGAKPEVIKTGVPAQGVALVVGKAALEAEPSLATALAAVVKKNPVVRADAIVVRRKGDRVYLAGTNDESHYFAASWLLQQWGCRWYLPTDFGEAIPEQPLLKVGSLDMAYAPPFEIRHYWLSWNGNGSGSADFMRRNFMTPGGIPGMGHALAKYTGDIVPPGKSHFNVPFSDPKTAEHVAAKIEAAYAAGKDISIAIEDGNYTNDDPNDKALITEYDRYSLKPSMTDAMMTFYNNVGKILRAKYPESKAKIGGMAYVNVTIPPKKVTKVEPNVVMWIAPIDIDPNHGMDDPKSPPRREYGAMMESWAKLMEGRLAVYDYDQGMLVWRDLPDPSQQAFAEDVKHYAKAGILGIGTESRGAMGTIFLNLFFRGQLMWNPNADVTALQNEFYPKFYGPAAKPMADYWNAIFDAWKNTAVTEHEFMAAPAVYTPALVAQLQKSLEQAEAAVKPLEGATGRNEKLYLQRMEFTRHSFDIIQNYMGMVTAAAHDSDFPQAVALGEKALAARMELAKMNPTFTTHVIGPGAETDKSSASWFPGEVNQYRALAKLTDGTTGTLIAKTPLEWAFHRDAPVPAGWTYTGPEGPAGAQGLTLATQEPTGANDWSLLSTDVYLQGQGILTPDGQSYTGHYWYQTALDLTADQVAGKTHLMFPGLFNETWLYVNGQLAAHREGYTEPWWRSNYKFEWDVDLTGKLKPGKNLIALYGFNPHHFGGIFRRPFFYRAQ